MKQLELLPHEYRGEIILQRASDGYVNATAMCRVAGREYSRYRELKATNEFLSALSLDLGLSEVQLNPNKARHSGGRPQESRHMGSPADCYPPCPMAIAAFRGQGNTMGVRLDVNGDGPRHGAFAIPPPSICRKPAKCSSGPLFSLKRDYPRSNCPP